MPVTSVVYVVEAPLSDRDAERFGLGILASAGLAVEVWDVHRIYRSRPDAATVERARGFPLREFDSRGDLVTACRALRSDTAVILLSGVYTGDLATHRDMISALMQSGARLGAVNAGQRPPIPDAGEARTWVGQQRDRVSQQWRAMRSGRTRPGRIAKQAASRAAARAYEWSARKGLRRMRHLDWVWAGPDVDSIEPFFIGRGTVVRYIHTWDYDLLLRDPEAAAGEPLPLYLDAMGPLHPDFPVLGIHVEVPADRWFGLINETLSSIEERLGARVVVAAHPRAEPGSLDGWYGDREVKYGETARLIPHAPIVLVSDPTTSLGLVAVHRRPATVLRPPRLFDTHLIELDQYARLLDLDVVEVAHLPDGWVLPSVDEQAYAAFVGRYVKRPGTPEEPFWRVVAQDLLAVS